MAVYFLLCCDFFSLCVGHCLDVTLVVCVCALFISVCLPCSKSVCSWGLSLCVPVYLCLSIYVFMSCFSVFDVLGFKDASACACLYVANVCVFMPLRCVYVFQWACFHKPPAYQYWRVCKGSHYIARFPLMWHIPAVHRQVIDSVCSLHAAWSKVAQKGTLEL